LHYKPFENKQILVTLLIASIPKNVLYLDNLLSFEYYFSSLFPFNTISILCI